jgi:hypothetical protein
VSAVIVLGIQTLAERAQHGGVADFENIARELFPALRRLVFLAMELNPVSA